MKTKDLGDISRAFAATARTAGSSRPTSDAAQDARDAIAFLEAEIDRLRGALERILVEHVGIVVGSRTYCRICAPSDGRWPCVTVMEARDALGVGE